MKCPHRNLCNAATICVLSVAVMVFSPRARANDWPQFRSQNRDGLSVEKGLLQKWPEGGPPKVWTATEIGNGHGSMVVVKRMSVLNAAEGIALSNDSISLRFNTEGRPASSVRKADGTEFLPDGRPGDRFFLKGLDGGITRLSSLSCGPGQSCGNSCRSSLRW